MDRIHDVNFNNLPQMVSELLEQMKNLETKINIPAKNQREPVIINGEDLCKKLDITIQTLIRWRQKEKIPYLQIGSSIRYDLNKVLDAIEVGKKKGAKAK